MQGKKNKPRIGDWICWYSKNELGNRSTTVISKTITPYVNIGLVQDFFSLYLLVWTLDYNVLLLEEIPEWDMRTMISKLPREWECILIRPDGRIETYNEYFKHQQRITQILMSSEGPFLTLTDLEYLSIELECK